MEKTTIIGVSGASGSGKSTFSAALVALLPDCYYLSADKHYKNPLPRILSPLDGQAYPDWNHPSAIDASGVVRELEEAAKTHPYVLIDGAFIYCIPALLSLFDFKIYVDASMEMRFYRRIRRNLQKGQTLEFIAGYYLNCARYREKEYSLTTQALADVVVDNEKDFVGQDVAVAEQILKIGGVYAP